MSSRIIETEVLSVRREALSPFIGIHWNPDNTGHIDFWVSQLISENGQFTRIEPDVRPGFQPLSISIADILPRTFMVDNPSDPENPIAVPCALLMGAIKQAFDDIYTERILELENLETPEVPEEN